MSKLKFGWAETFLLPEGRKFSLAGQFAERISESVEKPLTATALAIDSGDDQAVFCSCDIVSTSFKLCEQVRAMLKDNKEGLDPAKVMFNAIHTHTGPSYNAGGRQTLYMGSTASKDLLKELLPPDKKYVEKAKISEAGPEVMQGKEMTDYLAQKMYEAVITAWKNRKAGSFVNAFGRAVVGHCRRIKFNDGTAQMWGESNSAMFHRVEAAQDTGVELLYFFNENGKLTGIAANVACPAQCVQHRMFISPDFWGEAKKLLREHFGNDIFLLPLCSAAGDQCPVDMVRWVEPESDLNDPNINHKHPLKRKADPSMFDLAGMKKAGKRVANEIIEVYNEGLDEKISDADFVHHVNWFQLPIRRTTLTDVKKAKEEIEKYLAKKGPEVDYNDAANLQIYLGTLRREKLQELMETLDTEVHTIKLGNVAICTNPFELFLEYGNQIRARSYAEQTFIIQLCCGQEGYLPTEEAELAGHYSAFVSSGVIGHIGGEQLVRETLKDINEKLFK